MNERIEQMDGGRASLNWPALALVAGLAIIARALHLALTHDSPLYGIPHGDGRAYLDWADRLRRDGLLEGDRGWYQAPLYPHFLAALRSVFGESLLAIRCVQACLGALTAVLIAAATTRTFDRKAGVAAGLIVALSPTSIWLDGLIQKSALTGVLIACCLWLATFERRRAQLSLGAAMGLLMLTRGEARLWVALVLIVFAFGRRWRGLAAVTFGLVFVLAPALARNIVVADAWAVTTTQSWPNAYIGNGAGATGLYRPLRLGRGDASFEAADARDIARAGLGLESTSELSDARVSAYWRDRTVREMSADKWRSLTLFTRKAGLALNDTEVADTDDLGHARRRSFVLWSPLSFRVIFALALVGTVFLVREERRRAWPLWSLGAAQFTALVLFFVFARYRLPLTLALVPLAGVGVCRLRRFGQAPRLAVGAVLVGIVVSSLPLLDAKSGLAAALANEATALLAGDQPTEALSAARESVALDGEQIEGRRALAQALMTLGESAQALPHLEELHAALPGQWQLGAWLGIARAETDDAQGARALLDRAALERPEALPIISNAVALAMAAGDTTQVARLCEARLAIDGGVSSRPFRLQLAWIRATSASDNLRNGEQAVRLTEDVQGGPDVVSVRAAALMEAGRFDAAAALLEGTLRSLEANEAGAKPSASTRLSSLLQASRRRKPWRED